MGGLCLSNRLAAVHQIQFEKLKRSGSEDTAENTWKGHILQVYSKKGPVPKAVIPLCDTLICPEVLPRDQIVEVPATNKEGLINYRSSIGKTLVLPQVMDHLGKVLLPASGPGKGGEGAPTCQWPWTRW
jgi:hypothetical protein